MKKGQSIVLAALVLGLVTACNSKISEPLLPAPTPLPTATSPEGVVQRFIAVWNQRDSEKYADLFTESFMFERANARDPDLLSHDSLAVFFKEAEVRSVTNLFRGGVNREGLLLPAANLIQLEFIPEIPQDDPGAGRDPALYKVLATQVKLMVRVPPFSSDVDSTLFVIGFGVNPERHRFFLVRGDAAERLSANQPADSKHWYIRRWIEETEPPLPAPRPGFDDPRHPESVEENFSWGRLKQLYR